jgi:hypothetical protein
VQSEMRPPDGAPGSVVTFVGSHRIVGVTRMLSEDGYEIRKTVTPRIWDTWSVVADFVLMQALGGLAIRAVIL